VIHPEFTALWLGWRKLHESSIRWKAFWVEAASSLYGGGERAALVMQVVSEGGAATRRSRSRGQRCPRVIREGNLGDLHLVGSRGESHAVRRALTGWCRLGVPADDEGTSEVGAKRIGQGSSRRNKPRGVRMQAASNRRKTGLLRELGLERARVRSMESVERPATERQGMHRSASYRSWWAVTPPPILPGSGGANHTGLVGKGIDSNR
jgi:hypothetical protein